jgi:hypothetical protein
MMRAMGILLLLAAAGVCQAAQTDNLRQCHENAASNPDLAIRACTAAIDSRQLSGSDVASASYDRSVAYLHKGDFGLALEDFIQAAGRRPSIVPLWIWIVMVVALGQVSILWRRREAERIECNRLQVADAPRLRDVEAPALRDSDDDVETLPAPLAENPPEMVVAEVFDSQHEAGLARALLESENIPTFLADEYTYNKSGGTLGGLRLFVPAPLLAEAHDLLHAQISDEELAAQAEASGKEDEPPDAG